MAARGGRWMNVVYVVNVGSGYRRDRSEDFRAFSDIDFAGAAVCKLSGQRTQCTQRSWEASLRRRAGRHSFNRPRRDPVSLIEPVDLRELLAAAREGKLGLRHPACERAQYCRESRDSIRSSATSKVRYCGNRVSKPEKALFSEPRQRRGES
jgi:hypothetical protein